MKPRRRPRRKLTFPWVRTEWMREDAKRLPGGWLDSMARHAEWERAGRLGGAAPAPWWRRWLAEVTSALQSGGGRPRGPTGS